MQLELSNARGTFVKNFKIHENSIQVIQNQKVINLRNLPWSPWKSNLQ
jgi:hypothetical protein